MPNKKELVFNGIPKKNKFIQAILNIKFLVKIPLLKYIIKKNLKNCKNIRFSPGFKYFYGKIYAKNVDLGNTFFMDYAPIRIGDGTHFSIDNMVITSHHDRKDFNKIIANPVIIGKNVWISTRCTILEGVTIGDNSIIGAGSVVTKDIPANCFAAGNPARVVKKFT